MGRILALACLLLCAPPGARADDVTDQMSQALSAYQKKDYAAAAAALDAAGALVRQFRSDLWKALLPDPRPGWTADEAEGSAIAAAVLGGGTGASRSYHNGEQKVDITLLTDSPMLQAVGAMLTGVVATGMGIKTVVISGQRMAYMKDDNSYTALIANKIMVKVEGTKDVPDATLRDYVAAIRFADLVKAAP